MKANITQQPCQWWQRKIPKSPTNKQKKLKNNNMGKYIRPKKKSK